MTNPVADAVREALGEAALERDATGLPRAVPDSTDAVAQLFALAHARNWTLRLEGHGGWLPADAPADLAVSTRGLARVVSVAPADLVATVEAGVPLDALHRALTAEHMWFAFDPPGRPNRSLGSAAATGTSGPLRQGFGPIRDHVLGMTVVSGDGRVVRSGGRVVKNVAGYDLAKLHIGGFGGFGLITEMHLRLRAIPQSDVTRVAHGDRDALTAAAREITDGRLTVHAMELLSPAVAVESAWVLAVRLVGTSEGVAAEAARLRALAPQVEWSTVAVDRAAAFWHWTVSRAMLGGSTTLRLGVLQPGLDELLDLLGDTLGEGLTSAGAGSAGGLRWSGEADAPAILDLRQRVARQEIPLTLERAPWPLRRAVGHFGAWRAGVSQLVGGLRDTFDPGSRFAVALEARHEAGP
jgi:glycolate oxidase FAD binding subunit